jgi:integrase/recombinase XerD
MQIFHPHFKLILDTRSLKKSGLYPVKLRLTFMNKQYYYKTGIDLNHDDFEEVCKEKVSKQFREIKIKLEAGLVKAKNIQLQMPSFSVNKFNELFYDLQPKQSSLVDLYEKVIKEKLDSGSIGTAENYQCSLNSILKFKPKCTFEDIDNSFLKRYEKSLVDSGKSISTVGIYLRPLRAILNKALSENLISSNNYPFKKGSYTIPSSKNIKKALSKDDIKQIINMSLVSMSTKEKARDFWVLSYLLNGMNVTDICNLKFDNIDGDYLRFIRQKTHNTSRSLQTKITVPILPFTKELINKWSIKQCQSNDYIFGIISETDDAITRRKKIKQFTKTINKYMKLISDELNFKTPALSYSARHSFSTILKQSGASIEMISESLGHSSTAVTKSYLDSFDDESKLKLSQNLLDF